MKVQNGTFFFYLPSFLSNPVIIFLIGLLLGGILIYIFRGLFRSKLSDSGNSFSNNNPYSGKMDVLANMSPQQIVGRSRAILEITRTLNRMQGLMVIHKPTHVEAVYAVQNAIAQGNKIIMNDNIDFYELIGNWGRLKDSMMPVLTRIETETKSKSISNEEFRRDMRMEILKLRELLSGSND